MARDQKIKVRIEADGSSVDTTVKSAQRRLGELESESKKLSREFESGKRSADDYAKALAKIDKESASLKDGLAGVGASTKGTTSSLASFGSAIKANIAAVTAAVAAVAAFTKGLIEAGKAAYEHERNVKRLESALKPLGDAARGVRDQLLEQASALAAVTGQSDTTIVSMQALLAQMGVSGDKLALAAQASVDLSAALGIDLTSAARNVGRTMGGFAGELGELIPELKNLSAEALQAGEGIDFLAQKFKGTAEAARTGAESFGELGNAMADWGRNIVSIIANNKEVMNLVDALAEAIRQLTPEFEHNENVLSSWKDVVIDANDTISLQVGAIRDWLTEIGKAPSEIDAFIRNLVTLRGAGFTTAEAFEKLVTSWQRAIDIQREMDKANKSLATSLSALGVKLSSELNSELERLEVLTRNVSDQYRNGEISARDYAVATEAISKKQAELKGELTGATTSIKENTEAAKENAEAMHSVAVQISNAGQAAIRTAAQFDALAASAGRATAVSAAIAGGATLGLGGTRVYLPGGGSRLTSSPGLTGVFFNPEKRSYVSPGGGVVFV